MLTRVEKPVERDIECFRESLQGFERRDRVAMLYPRDIAPMQAADAFHGALRKALLFAEFANPLAD